MTSTFLTQEDMLDLTGYKQAAKQIEQLKKMRIPFHVNAAGHPKVARATIEGQRAKTTEANKTWSPSWGGVQPQT